MRNLHYVRWDHDENRKKLCAQCCRKIFLGTRKINFFKIARDQEQLIKKLVNSNFSLSDPKFPLIICYNCIVILKEHSENNFHRSFKTMPNYEDIILQKKTRASNEDQICNCFIC